MSYSPQFTEVRSVYPCWDRPRSLAEQGGESKGVNLAGVGVATKWEELSKPKDQGIKDHPAHVL